MMMSSDTVMDSVNKYRHGVLIGNFVQDQFGRDLQARGPNPDAPKITTTKTNHDLAHSLHKTNQFINNQNKSQNQFYSSSRSIHNQPYVRPEHESSYNIHHGRQIQNKFLLMENNPKREEALEKQGKLYDQTRYYLANKFTRQNGDDPTLNQLPQEIPDILTGQILKARPNIGSEVKVDQKGKTKIQAKVNTKSINPFGTYTVVKPQIQRFEEVQYQKLVQPHHKGEKRDMLFGHGLNLQDFQRRQLATSYELSYGQKVPPQTQINSFYEPDHKQVSAREYHRQTFYEKNHQSNVPSFGDNHILCQEKVGRPYQPYTATYDKNHLKHEYLRK